MLTKSTTQLKIDETGIREYRASSATAATAYFASSWVSDLRL